VRFSLHQPGIFRNIEKLEESLGQPFIHRKNKILCAIFTSNCLNILLPLCLVALAICEVTDSNTIFLNNSKYQSRILVGLLRETPLPASGKNSR
jgi:hypothetical protein